MTVLKRVGAPLLLIALLGVVGDPSAVSFEPTILPGVARDSSPPDTMRATAHPDRALILALPDSLSDGPVERYTVLRGPALSGVAGRSFTWVPENASRGTHEVLLEAHHSSASPDTLVLRIDLHP